MTPPDIVKDVLGIDAPPEQVAEDLKAYADVLAEIAKLRALDLSHLQPAVIFSPVGKPARG